MKTFALVSLLAGAAILSGCGVEKTELKYEYECNGCKTGSHSFDSTEAYCAGLQNSELNDGCCRSTREADFQSKCSGTFTET